MANAGLRSACSTRIYRRAPVQCLSPCASAQIGVAYKGKRSPFGIKHLLGRTKSFSLLEIQRFSKFNKNFQKGQWAGDVVKGVSGECIALGPTKLTIRNAATNRKKTVDKDRAVKIPENGSFVKSPDGQWWKISKTAGNEIKAQEVKILPEELAALDAADGKGMLKHIYIFIA